MEGGRQGSVGEAQRGTGHPNGAEFHHPGRRRLRGCLRFRKFRDQGQQVQLAFGGEAGGQVQAFDVQRSGSDGLLRPPQAAVGQGDGLGAKDMFRRIVGTNSAAFETGLEIIHGEEKLAVPEAEGVVQFNGRAVASGFERQVVVGVTECIGEALAPDGQMAFRVERDHVQAATPFNLATRGSADADRLQTGMVGQGAQIVHFDIDGAKRRLKAARYLVGQGDNAFAQFKMVDDDAGRRGGCLTLGGGLAGEGLDQPRIARIHRAETLFMQEQPIQVNALKGPGPAKQR